MADPTATKHIFLEDDLSAKKVRELVINHNRGVVGDHAVCSTLDGEGGDVDVDYEAQLTALEIRNTEGAPTESATTETHDLQFLDEQLLVDLITQVKARATDIAAIVAKLNADAGIAANDYAESVVVKVSALGVAGDGGGDLLAGAGGGPSGRLVQHITEIHAQLEADWHAAAVKLDADGGLAGSYESVLTAEVLTEG